MDIMDHPQFDGYDKAWGEKAQSLSKTDWSKGYDKAFLADVKSRGWEPIQPGRTRLQYSPAQAEAFSRAVRGKSALDFGCGPGYVTIGLVGKGINCIGVDCSREAINFCKKHGSGKWADHFSVGYIDDVAALNHKFDTVFAIETLEHVKDPAKTIEVLWSKVEDEGSLVVTVPKNGIIPSPYHIHEFSYDDMAGLAKAAMGDKEYIADITELELEWLLTIRKELILIRYVQVVGRTDMAMIQNDILETGRPKTGIYNWSRIFNGESKRLEEVDVTAYDVLHVQLAGDSFDAPRILREKIGPPGPDVPKLIVNLDYAPEYWYQYPAYPEMLFHQMNCADYVFAQNDLSAAILSDALGHAVPMLPHPVETNAIKQHAAPWNARNIDKVAVIAHRDMNVFLPRFVFREMGVQTHLWNFTDPPMAAGTVSQPRFAYTKVEPMVSTEDFLKSVVECGIAYDTYIHSVQGRATMELACLGIPTIGHECVDAQKRCFASLTTKPNDVARQRRLLKRLREDQGFYLAVAETAQREVEHYNFERSKDRFLRMIGHESTTERPVIHGAGGNGKGLEVGAQAGGHPHAPTIIQP